MVPQQADVLEAWRADRSVERSVCDHLTGLCWKAVRGQLESDVKVAELARELSAPDVVGAPQIRHRIYELVQLAALVSPEMWLDDVGGTPKEDAMAAFISRQTEEIQTGMNVTSAQFFRGAAEVALGRYDSGMNWFSRANYNYNTGNTVTSFFGYSRGVCPTSVVDSAVAAPQRNHYRTSWRFDPAPIGGGPVLVVAGDRRYIERFFLRYCETLAEYAPLGLGGVHLHLVDVEPDNQVVFDIIDQAGAILPVPLSLSREAIRPIKDLRPYLATARFWAAREVMEHYRAPVLITDIDYTLTGSLEAFLSEASDYDVCYRGAAGLARIFPWLRIVAGTIYVNRTSMGSRFLTLIESVFLSIFNPINANWGIDQNIISSAERSLGREGAKMASFAHFFNPHPFSVPYALKAGTKT